MGNNSETKDVSNKPCIHAGDMSPKELRDWLDDMANSANSMNSFNLRATDARLNGMTATARDLVDDLTKKINFLQCREISRSEDHASAIQVELLHYQGMLKSVSDFLQAAEPYLTQNAKNHQINPCQRHECGVQECKALATHKSD